MTEIKAGNVERKADLFHTYIHRFGAGNVATDGVVYSPIATFGTTGVEVLNELIDPGVNMDLKQIEVGLTQSFTELLSANGSLRFQWKVREEWHDSPAGTLRTESYVGVFATQAKSFTTGQTLEDTFSGYLAVGSFRHAPLRVVLTAACGSAIGISGKVKNSSYIKLVGIIIPGA